MMNLAYYLEFNSLINQHCYCKIINLKGRPYVISYRNNAHSSLLRLMPTVLPAVLLLMVFIAPISFAQDINWASLNLSSQQRSTMTQYESEWERLCAQLLPQIDRDKTELMSLLNSPNSDPQRIMELKKRISDNKSKLENKSLEVFLNKKKQLSPDQLQKLQQQMKNL